MKAKYLIGGGLIISGGVLYYFMSRKSASFSSNASPILPTFVPKETVVAVTDTSVLTTAVLDNKALDPTAIDTFTEVINELAPQVVTEQDKKQEALAQYFLTKILESEKYASGCISTKVSPLALQRKNMFSQRIVAECNAEQERLLSDYKMKLQQIGYGYSLGKIYKIR